MAWIMYKAEAKGLSIGSFIDKTNLENQKLTWEALEKRIDSLINKITTFNLQSIVQELLKENLIRGRGLLCRSLMQSQLSSPELANVFAALAAALNCEFPDVGRLLVTRVLAQMKSGVERNDKNLMSASAKFMAHLVNQRVVIRAVALALVKMLLESWSEGCVEVAVRFVIECGAFLEDVDPRLLNDIIDCFHQILRRRETDQRARFLINGLFTIRNERFHGHPAVLPELDLGDKGRLTHTVSLKYMMDPETSLDIFKPDPQFLDNEKYYRDGISSSDSSSDSGSDESETSDDL